MDKEGEDLTEWKIPSSVPPYGWKVRCDYKFPQKRKQAVEPTFHQMRVLLPLVLRYIWYSIKMYFAGRKPCMDFYTLVQNKKKSGVTLGGIGAGCIGRGFKGEFCRFHMDPGNYKYEDIVADQFIATIYNEEGRSVYQKVLSTYHKSCFMSSLRKWDWSFPPQDAHYTALYPRAWYTYEIKDPAQDIDIKLTCHQISPIIPHNYKDSSLPVSVFEWTVDNNSPKACQVSITMTMRDGDGTHHCTRKSIKTSEKFEQAYGDESVLGVTIKQRIAAMPCHYSIAALKNDNTVVQRCLYFDPSGDGKTFWQAISSDKLEKFTCGSGKQDLGCAVKSKVKLNALSNSSEIRFVLAWDMPKVNFAHSPNQHLRFYTQFFGCQADAGPKICLYAFENYKRWVNEIHAWQEPILSDKDLPNWYKSALFNELYYVADGGTVWFLLDDEDAEKLPEDDPRKIYGRFGYLEGHEYKMYNTYDVHFYASFALAMLWPGLQKSVQYDFRDSISFEDPTPIWYLYDGAIAPRKVKDSVPHDLGEPDDDPFKIINIYPVHDVSGWKDLNTKFVLQVYRDFVLTDDLNYLRDMYPQVLIAMNTSLKWDSEKLGIIQNSGFPDQTYDTWVMRGVSAYCGGLFLAATKATIEIAKKMNDDVNRDKFEDVLSRGKKAFDDKLWNGKYYNFDSSDAEGFDTIMSDQLCGLWYLNACKVKDEVFFKSHVTSALNTIYNFNVKKYYDGAQGALNGMKPNGQPCRVATQSEESWTGVTYALASLLISEGMTEEGFSTAKGLYETIFDKAGLGFASPEALHGLDTYRAVGYMRPLSIWSIQHMLNIRRDSPAS